VSAAVLGFAYKLARLALCRRKKKKGTVNRFAKVRGGRRAASQVPSYDMNSRRLAVRCRHKGTRSEFELDRTVMDASGHHAIEINEWSTFGAELGKFYRLDRADQGAGVINHVYDCRSSFLGVGLLRIIQDSQSLRANQICARKATEPLEGFCQRLCALSCPCWLSCWPLALYCR
jgi:hypothetical protein